MKKFVKFQGDIWEKDDRTLKMLWMESVNKQLRDKKKPLKKKEKKKETEN